MSLLIDPLLLPTLFSGPQLNPAVCLAAWKMLSELHMANRKALASHHIHCLNKAPTVLGHVSLSAWCAGAQTVMKLYITPFFFDL